MKLRNLFLLALLMLFGNVVAQDAKTASMSFKDWAPTPPMGWNSWDCYGPTVEESEVKANADYMAEKLRKYGWEYVVVDIRWFVKNDKAGGYNQTDAVYLMDDYGRYYPAVNRFPSAEGGKGFKPLADYVHSKGLKFGIHIMRGVPKIAVYNKMKIKDAGGITADMIYSTEGECQWLRDNYTIDPSKPGAQEYYNSIMELYASWGVDFIKIDDLSHPYHKGEIEMIRKAIDACGRPIVLSMSPGQTPLSEADHACAHANMWREVDDVWDVWKDVDLLLKIAPQWYPYISKGNWPDCDMIPLGRISIRGERGKPRMTRLSKDEQYSLMTLFTISKSPLFFGGDLPSNDEFTLSLLTNKEVLRMHRESEGVRLVSDQGGRIVIASRNPKTKETYVAMFNASNDQSQSVSVSADELGVGTIMGKTMLWDGKKDNSKCTLITETLRPHASVLFKLNTK